MHNYIPVLRAYGLLLVILTASLIALTIFASDVFAWAAGGVVLVLAAGALLGFFPVGTGDNELARRGTFREE